MKTVTVSFLLLTGLLGCKSSPVPSPSITPVPTVATPTPTPTIVVSDLADVIKVIETGTIRKQKYVARPTLSSKDTILLKGNMKGLRDKGTEGVQKAVAAATVDLRLLDTPVKNQGQEGLCTAFAVSGAAEMGAKLSGKTIDLSERHLWNQYLQYYTVSALNASVKVWITTENVWPYAKAKAVSAIVPKAKNTAYHAVSSWQELWTALDGRKPVVLSADTNTSWSNPYKGVLLATGTKQGGHAIKVSGYFDTTKGRYIIIKNSWGAAYGDKGYVYMPMSYCSKYFCAFHVIDGTETK